MENMSNYELLELYKRMLVDGFNRMTLPVQEEIFIRMREDMSRPQLTLIKGGIA
jgi:hypothetical protein